MDEIQRSTSAHRSVNIWQMVLLVLGGVLIALVIFPPLFTAEAAPDITVRKYSLDQASGEYTSTNLDRFESRIVMLPRSNLHPNPYSHKHRHKHRYAYCNRYSYTHRYSHTHTNANRHGDANSDHYANGHANSHPDRYRHHYSKPCFECDSAIRSEARIGEALVFTIAVRNNGTAPMHDVFILSTSFPTTVNLDSVVVSPSVAWCCYHHGTLFFSGSWGCFSRRYHRYNCEYAR